MDNGDDENVGGKGEDSWSCSKCTFKNSILLPHCELCDSVRDSLELKGESNYSTLACIEKPSVSKTTDSFQLNDDGIMSALEVTLTVESSKKKGGIGAFRLSSPACNHYSQKGSPGARWSCGYRNIQMVSSSLLQLSEYRAVMFDGSGRVPSVIELQQWIERAWAAGFDAEGARHFGHSLQGSSAWIGATECVALLRFFGLRARVVDFAERKGPRGRLSASSNFASNDPHPNPATGKRSREEDDGDGYDDPAAALQSWVARYFGLPGPGPEGGGSEEGERSRPPPPPPPLYLQYAGHSRTIVGAARPASSSSPEEVNLVLLDPSKETRALRRTLLLEHADGQGKGGPTPATQTLTRLRHTELLVSTPRRLLHGRRDKGSGSGSGSGGGSSEEFQVVYVSAGVVARGSLEWEKAKRIQPDQP